MIESINGRIIKVISSTSFLLNATVFTSQKSDQCSIQILVNYTFKSLKRISSLMLRASSTYFLWFFCNAKLASFMT